MKRERKQLCAIHPLAVSCQAIAFLHLLYVKTALAAPVVDFG